MSTERTQDPALFAQQPLGTQSGLEPSAIEWMLIAFAQDLQLFAEARTLIAPHHFKHPEGPLRLAYEAMCVSLDRYNGLTFETVSDIATQMLQGNQSIILNHAQQQIIFAPNHTGLLYQICNPEGIDFCATNRSLARDLLQRFAHERTIVEPLRRVMNPGFNSGIPENLGDFLEVINNQQARLSTLQTIPEVSVAPELGSTLVQSNVFHATGIPFIDEVLGGQREGDCNGLIGPTGGGKTTLAIQMAVAAAKQCWAEAQATGEPPKIVVFISAEEAAHKLRPRIWSAFFNIPREKLETMQDWSVLTAPGQLDSYEMQMQHDQEHKLSESERYQLNAPQLSQCFKLVDLSGSDEFPEAGNGYIPEIVSYLSRYQQRIHSVYIDYAGLMCERYMATTNQTDSYAYRRLLKNFGDACRKQISERFRCTTWVLHQLKGDAGNSSPFKLMHHTDASESKDFAVNMAICGCLSVVDPHSGCRRFNWSKVRYKPGEAVPPITLRIHSKFAFMEDVTRLFVIDEGSRQFVSASDANAVHGTDNLSRRQTQMAGPAGMRNTDEPLDPSQRADF